MLSDISSSSERVDSLVAAVVQMSSTDDWHENLDQALRYIRVAAEQGAELIVLPENFLCFSQSSLGEFAPHVDACLQQLSALSDTLGVSLVCGSLPVSSKAEGAQSVSDKYYSRCYFFDGQRPQLESKAYDKIHLFDVDVADGVGAYRESDKFAPGSEPVINMVSGRGLGMSICYDLRFPELYQHYMQHQVDMISVPAAFTYVTGEQHWEILLRARAIETQCYILAANQCGEHSKGRFTWGHSMIVSPSGEVLVEAGHQAGVYIAELNFTQTERTRKAMPLLSHKRL